MKTRFLLAVLTASTLLLSAPLRAADGAAAPNDAHQELQQLIGQINAKVRNGQNTAADLAPELKQFDTLLAEHKGEKTDAVAQILFMKAMLYVEVLNDPVKGADLIRQLKADYPDTVPGKQADQLLSALQRQVDDAKIQAALPVGAKFPGFEETDLAGKPLSLAAYKGKVVLVDFWATWCGPCVHELPNVIAAYKKYHGKGFDIVGISLDEDKGKLTGFMKEHGMTWAQFYDGKGWNNKLALKYGIDSIPSTFLLDGNGTIIARDLRGPALEAALAKQLGGS